jgi:hypothetical protein
MINKRFSTFGITIRYVFFSIMIATTILFYLRILKLRYTAMVL